MSSHGAALNKPWFVSLLDIVQEVYTCYEPRARYYGGVRHGIIADSNYFFTI